MERQQRAATARRSHASTSGLLTWQEVPPEAEATPPAPRSNQPAGAIAKVVFGGQPTEEEAESLNKRKPCSAPKWKEMTGSGIFAHENGEDILEDGHGVSTPNCSPNRPASRNYQAISTVSHISFAEEEALTPKKPNTVAEMAKQRELSGSIMSESEDMIKRQVSVVKCKELSGHDIFAPPEDPPSVVVRRDAGTLMIFWEDEEADGLIKTAKKIPMKKLEDLNGKNIFTGDTAPETTEKSLSTAKLKEIKGSNIFADGKVVSRDYFGGVRKPPGGESSIALV